MSVIRLLPQAGLIVTALSVAAVANPDTPSSPQKPGAPSPTKKLIHTKEHVTEGIRILEIDQQEINRMTDVVRETGELKVKGVPLPEGGEIDLELQEAKVFAPGAKFVIQSTDDPSKTRTYDACPPEDALVLTGQVAGEADSFAMLALSKHGSFGMIQTDAGTSFISSGKLGSDLDPIIYDPKYGLAQAIDNAQFQCGTEPNHLNLSLPSRRNDRDSASEGGLAGSSGCHIVRLALEYDYEMWSGPLQRNGWYAVFYTWALVAGIDQIYRRDARVAVEVSWVRAWADSNDPWDKNNASDQAIQLYEWYLEHGDDIERDATMLLTARVLDRGLTRRIEAYSCEFVRFIVCHAMTGRFPYPLVEVHADNRDIGQVAHELGHALGSTHTHNYCPPLDQCAPPAGFGECQEDQICQRGTLMSYCYLCPGGMQNFELRLHPVVAEYIHAYLDASPCFPNHDAIHYPADDRASTRAGSPVTIDVLSNDRATCSSFELGPFDAESAAGGSVISFFPPGSNLRRMLTYIPPVDFVGEDSFTYWMMDYVGGIHPATVTIEVTPALTLGDLMVVDALREAIDRFDLADGKYLGTLLPPGEGLQRPQAICDGPGEYLYVANDFSDSITYFTPDSGQYKGVFAEGPQFARPSGLESDGQRLYFASTGGQEVVVLDATGNVERTYEVGREILDIQLNDHTQQLIIAWRNGVASGGGGIEIWNTQTDKLIASFATPEIEYPSSVCRHPGGDLLAADFGGERIARYDGQYHGFKGWFIDADQTKYHGLSAPGRLETGPDDLVYFTSETGLHRLTSAGDYLDSLASGEDSVLALPRGLHFNAVESILGDLDGDGDVDGADLSLLLGNWNTAGAGDLDGDGLVSGADLALLLGNWN